MLKTRFIAAAALATAAFAANAASAGAVTTPQIVAGVPDQFLAIGVATPVVPLSPFQPGSTATGTAAMTVTTTLPSWALSVEDDTNGGLLAKDGVARDLTGDLTGLLSGGVPDITQAPALTDTSGNPVVCSGGAATTANQLAVQDVTGLVGATKAATAVGAISGTPRTIANGSLIGSMTVDFQLPINSDEALASTCTYDTSLTYTAQ